MKIQRILTNLCSDNLAASKDFYVSLFGLEVAFDSDWFINLKSESPSFELGIIQRDHAIVPEGFRKTPQGMYLTFVVPSADDIFALAKEKGFNVLEEPMDTFYGQRRLLLQDPDGTLVDVSSLIADFKFNS